MAKDLDLALAYGARRRGPAGLHGHRPAGAHRRHRRRVRAGGLLVGGQGGLRPVRAREVRRREPDRPAPAATAGAGPGGRPPGPGGADHRALRRLPARRCAAALPPLRRHPGHRPAAGRPGPRGCPPAPSSAPTSRSTAPVWPARRSSSTTGWWPPWGGPAADGWTGVKLMTRIDPDDPGGAAALELLGRVLEEARTVGARGADRAGAVAGRADVPGDRRHRAGRGHRPRPRRAPAQGAGARRTGRVRPGSRRSRRVVDTVGVPVLFLGGPHVRGGGAPVDEVASDVMDGGAAGLAVGRVGHPGPGPGGRGGAGWPRSCTGGDPHPRPRDQPHQGGAVGAATDWSTWPGSHVATRHPAPGASEQDPSQWWASVVDGVRRGRGRGPGTARRGRGAGVHGRPADLRAVRRGGRPVGPAIVWSDGRAGGWADRPGAEDGDRRAVVRGGPAGMGGRHPDRPAWTASAWILAPRDVVVWRLTGRWPPIRPWPRSPAATTRRHGGRRGRPAGAATGCRRSCPPDR